MKQPGRFITCRVPEWATRVSTSISKGSKVTMCKNAKGEWKVQSVLVKKGAGKTKRDALRLGIKIRNKIEKR